MLKIHIWFLMIIALMMNCMTILHTDLNVHYNMQHKCIVMMGDGIVWELLYYTCACKCWLANWVCPISNFSLHFIWGYIKHISSQKNICVYISSQKNICVYILYTQMFFCEDICLIYPGIIAIARWCFGRNPVSCVAKVHNLVHRESLSRVFLAKSLLYE